MFTIRKKHTLIFVLSCISIIFAGCSGTKKEQVVGSVAYKPKQTEVQPQRFDDFEQPELTILRENHSQQIFKDYGVNPTISTEFEQHSTFAMDVDNVSYRIAKASIDAQRLPAKAAIRVEEFVNNSQYNYQTGGDTFSVSAQIAPSPFRPGFHVLHVGIQARQVSDQDRLPANLVLVADVSASMHSENKMALQKQAFTTLVSQLKPEDTVALVAYNSHARVLLKPTAVKHRSKIYRSIKRLKSGGSTNAAEGLLLGYELANSIAYPGHTNRVILTSDGMANIGAVDPDSIVQKINEYRQHNIFLTTVGVGKNMYNDYLLEQLANQGNGNYLYFANQSDVESAFVDRLTTQIQTVAKDAKVQLKFNPEMISHFRQLGYENRALQTDDFLNANKDGGELGANHQTTVLYEIKLRKTDKYKQLATLALSYKKPQGSQVLTIEKTLLPEIIQTNPKETSPDTTISIVSAAFAEKLRQSYWSRLFTYQDIKAELNLLPAHIKQSKQVQQLINLIDNASQIDARVDPYETDHPISKISYEQIPLLR
ncbi:MAG: YfbK domain-containing protein [Arenicella sp.]